MGLHALVQRAGWCQAVDADPLACVLACELAGERAHAGFRGRVGGAGALDLSGGGRGHRDDRAASPLDHRRQERLHRQEGGGEVRVDHPLPVGCGFLDGRHRLALTAGERGQDLYWPSCPATECAACCSCSATVQSAVIASARAPPAVIASTCAAAGSGLRAMSATAAPLAASARAVAAPIPREPPVITPTPPAKSGEVARCCALLLVMVMAAQRQRRGALPAARTSRADVPDTPARGRG